MKSWRIRFHTEALQNEAAQLCEELQLESMHALFGHALDILRWLRIVQREGGRVLIDRPGEPITELSLKKSKARILRLVKD